MALDTRNKRASLIGAARPWLANLPIPSGSIDGEDRQHFAYLYSGIQAGQPVVSEVLRLNYLKLNPKGAPEREVALAVNEILDGKMNVMSEIDISMAEPDGTLTFYNPNVHNFSGIFLEPLNPDAVELWPQLHVAETRDGSYDIQVKRRTLVNLGLLGGVADPISLGVTPTAIVNYPLAGDSGLMDGTLDPVQGEITLPFDGWYRVSAYVNGIHSSTPQNEAIVLNLRVDGVDSDFAVVDVATNKTDHRTLYASFVRLGTAGMKLALSMEGTTSFGTFTFNDTTLEVTLLQDLDDVPAPGNAKFNVLGIG